MLRAQRKITGSESGSRYSPSSADLPSAALRPVPPRLLTPALAQRRAGSPCCSPGEADKATPSGQRRTPTARPSPGTPTTPYSGRALRDASTEPEGPSGTKQQQLSSTPAEGTPRWPPPSSPASGVSSPRSCPGDVGGSATRSSRGIPPPSCVAAGRRGSSSTRPGGGTPRKEAVPRAGDLAQLAPRRPKDFVTSNRLQVSENAARRASRTPLLPQPGLDVGGGHGGSYFLFRGTLGSPVYLFAVTRSPRFLCGIGEGIVRRL